MSLNYRVLAAVLCFGFLQVVCGFAPLDGPAQPPEDPTEGDLRNVSLHRLSPGYLKHLYSESVTSLKISNSNIDAIERNAFDHLRHLNLLEISDSRIQEQIDPWTFSRLPGLEILVLRNVGLRRPHLNLTNVQELTLAQNEIETLDDGIVGRNLNFLDLSSNKLKVLRSSFAEMRKLSMIDISRNKIGELSPVFEENVNLLTILASENKFTSTNGLKLPWLKTLDLFANKLRYLTPESFRGMKSLNELVLAFNDIQHIEHAFQDLVELKYLNLAWNNLDELDPSLFSRNPYLTKLSLQGNRIQSLKKFRGVLNHLTQLDLSHNQLSLVDTDFFASTPSLRVLDLSFNRLKTLDTVLSPLSDLQVLNLAYNGLAMNGNELSANRQLAQVNLSSNALQGGVALFENNLLLKNLDLSDNKISHFCDGNVPKLLKLNLKGNQIKDLSCLENLESLCEVDFRYNPLTCGELLDGLVLALASRKGSPFALTAEFPTGLPNDRCENLSLNRSISLWNSVKRELCPSGINVEIETFEPSHQTDAPQAAKPSQKTFLPLGWIKNDEMNKPNPLENPQSGRMSWGNIEENSELLKGFEDEEVEKKPRFSWYTIALILIGLSLTLTCFNLVVFLYIRLKIWKRADAKSSRARVYSSLPNEVYKHTTEPSKVGEPEWSMENETNNKMFYGKLNEIFLNYFVIRKDKDSESAKNVLINPTSQ